MTGEHQREHLVADLGVVECRTVLIASAQKEVEEVTTAGWWFGAALGDDVGHDGIERAGRTSDTG